MNKESLALSSVLDLQDGNRQKRVVTQIKNYPRPNIIFNAITSKEVEYSKQYRPEYNIRDRALMALYFASAGRGAEVCGGHSFTRSLPSQFNSDGKLVCIICGNRLAGNQRKFCGKECRAEIHTHKNATRLETDHLGILIENIEFTDAYISIREMPTVKRTEAVKRKYPQAAIRPEYKIPLVRNLYKSDNELSYWDQLVPFGWLIKEYYDLYIKGEIKSGKLFNFQNRTAYRIVRIVTGNYLNWFRAQGKQFYGKFLFGSENSTSSAFELMQFVNDNDILSEKPYTRYDSTRLFKDKQMVMDFDWITPAVEAIKTRIEASHV